ncbi:uncharacterized protein Dwil_GK12994 [Drosophila willistoni]|uniref:Uncharacterized protein n=1 Tax=Drosophila willistoni TaxID=7260 RepID=B4NHT3_DROWI|nr:uncharacterized protein LOC6650928 [Drosophila willistoni]EDW84693.1 uncharacterized protein Dwil_GK12994 [Drosophila willistoni]
MAVKYYTKVLLFTCCLVLSQALPRYSYSRPLNGAGSASSSAYAPRPQQPMTLTGNYNLIMPDYYDHHPAASMQLQNFANFYDAQMSPGNDLGMDESRFLESSTPVRGPQPLTAHERKVRQKLPVLDVAQEKKSSLKLKKGNTKPRGADYQQWDQFDYDLYSVYPGESKKYKNDA